MENTLGSDTPPMENTSESETHLLCKISLFCKKNVLIIFFYEKRLSFRCTAFMENAIDPEAQLL